MFLGCERTCLPHLNGTVDGAMDKEETFVFVPVMNVDLGPTVYKYIYVYLLITSW